MPYAMLAAIWTAVWSTIMVVGIVIILALYKWYDK